MGLRFFKRRNARVRYYLRRVPICFNGAALFQAQKLKNKTIKTKKTNKASMGLRFFKRRNLTYKMFQFH